MDVQAHPSQKSGLNTTGTTSILRQKATVDKDGGFFHFQAILALLRYTPLDILA